MNKTLLFIITGAALGILAPILSYFGNPANMGICAACFLRDTSGALGLHQLKPLAYVRPEILGLVLGGLFSSLFWARDFRLSGSQNALSLFGLGAFAMIGALVFLGCPWRMLLRLGGGDMSALAGLAGLVAGVGVGFVAKKRGFVLDINSQNESKSSVLVLALFLIGLFVLLAAQAVDERVKHAPFWLSLGFAAVVGALVQRSKFCTTGAIARAFRGEWAMAFGALAVVVMAVGVNLILAQFKLGFTSQPIAHNEWLYNFAGMALAGLCFSLASGCAGKHLASFGAGSGGSGVFIFGMLFGASLAHNFALAASPKGAGENSALALAVGFIFCVLLIAINIYKKPNPA